MNADAETLAAVSKLTGLTNLVLNELALSYVPMKVTERKTVTDGKVLFSTFTKTPLKILDVLNVYGESVFYSVSSTHVKVSENEVDIVYSYIPSNYGLGDTVGYKEEEISSRIIAYAVCAEYMLAISDFSGAVMWRKRFTDELENMFAPKSKKMKRRSFL